MFLVGNDLDPQVHKHGENVIFRQMVLSGQYPITHTLQGVYGKDRLLVGGIPTTIPSPIF